MAEFERSAREMRAEQARELDSEEGIRNDPKKLDRLIDATKKLEDASKGDEAKMAKVMSLFLKDIQQDMAVMAKHQKALEEASNYGNIKSPEEIDGFSEKVKGYQKANQTLTEKIKTGWIKQLEENLKKANVNEKNSKDFMRGATSKFNQQRPYLLTIRSTDDELCEAMLAQHAILKKYWGQWKWDPQQEVPQFENDEAINAYNKEATKIQKASQEQYEAQQKLLKSQ